MGAPAGLCHANGIARGWLVGRGRGMPPLRYHRHRFPSEIIQHAIWLYLRFTLSYRDVEGELRLRCDAADEQRAEAGFRRALEIARAQKAKSWELRAATSLARLWGEQDRRAEALVLLAPVYGWFTEGFD